MSTKLATAIAKIVEEVAGLDQASSLDALARVGAEISRGFKVGNDEVALLGLCGSDNFLEFLFPEKLRRIGLIPMTSTTALAVRTAREKRPEVINNFSIVRHATVFEAVPLGNEIAEPIQKIMSVPILDARDRVLGVVQVSRKGRTPASAGPDFTPRDLSELTAIGRLLGPCIRNESKA
jgi:hypothetical protein